MIFKLLFLRKNIIKILGWRIKIIILNLKLFILFKKLIILKIH